ncbi:MAG: permease [Candidatus Buchananbacteria bacterium]|nr:permease [Candidatus Buchananbacteria bacterium]
MIEIITDYLIYDTFGLTKDSALGHSVEFFIYDSIKILLLLVVVTYLMSLIRYYLPIEKIRNFLVSKKFYGFDYFLAAFFGAITPFCSCSSIPLFIGFLGAKIPLGVTLAFLITSPLVNEVALVLLAGAFGWKITIMYATSGILIGMIGGYTLEKLRLEKYVQNFIWQTNITPHTAKTTQLTPQKIFTLISQETFTIISKVLPYLMAGIALGAVIHGYVPEGYFEKYITKENIFAVPLAVVIGIPLYSNASGIIPIIQALVAKGIPLGTALAFMMATVGLSLPEALILKKVMRWQLLASFFGVVGLGIIVLGYLFNAILP